MKIFKDLFSGDEVCSDIHPIKMVNPAVMCVRGKLQMVSNEIDDSLIGGNKSAEDADEGSADNAVSVINIANAHQLTETGFKNKKEYMGYIKDYMKRLTTKLEGEKAGDIGDFKKGAQEFVKSVVDSFSDWQFFMSEKYGEGEDGEGMIILVKYEKKDGDEEEMPYFYYFKHGLIEEKV